MLKLEIVTPEKRVFDADVDSVTVPTASGEAGILPNHAPLISALKPGVLTYALKGASNKFAVAGGFVEVSDNRVTVLADSAETADEIDVEAAKSNRDAAERALAIAVNGSVESNQAVREQLDAANVRIHLAAGK